ncbi:MAG: hypothetical protein KZQ88_08845 [Candidatus Thiodiazotropha sp. (ex Dulcina madagascariensis)]|nr:hypothetical protein [Candidatus Thiodiazotropha sp. (ex Dulcina madagascariensis)]MCU7927660.1 hypothetical protein [Candidatus Thiodiazotropha sp. (ex Dulcina madagascariensis)]
MIALISNTTSRYLSRVIFIGCLLLTGPVRSEVIHEHLGNGLVVSAEYLQSDNRRSPILILHGFLQTRDFFTVRRLADALKDAGYPVLLPNLSLGIDHRRQSLACDKMHRYPLAFCDKYTTTPGNYLSYLVLRQPRTLNTIVGLERKPSIILGSKDIRLGAEWKPRLQALKADIFEIEGANHFFDHTHEFDLFDTIEQLL